MSDQCQHCDLRGDSAKCKSTLCFLHENWGYMQLERELAEAKAQRNEHDRRRKKAEASERVLKTQVYNLQIELAHKRAGHSTLQFDAREVET